MDKKIAREFVDLTIRDFGKTLKELGNEVAK